MKSNMEEEIGKSTSQMECFEKRIKDLEERFNEFLNTQFELNKTQSIINHRIIEFIEE